MDNLFEKIVDILVAVLILFLFPVLYFGLKQDGLTQQVLQSRAADFIDNVRTQGFITKNMYESFLKELDATGNIYQIRLEQKELDLEPEYRFRTADEIINDQDSKWTGSNIYHYNPVSTSIPVITDTVNNDGLKMNTETNESVLAAAVDTPASSSHVHTTACYGDHEHSSHYLLPHTHTSACYCKGTITSVVCTNTVSDGGQGWYYYKKYYTATCGSCGYTISFREEAYSTQPKYGTANAAAGVYYDANGNSIPYSSVPKVGDACSNPNPVCGQDTGYVDCYAPPITWSHYSSVTSGVMGSNYQNWTVSCGKCGATLYTVEYQSSSNLGTYAQVTNNLTGEVYRQDYQGSGGNNTAYNSLYLAINDFVAWLGTYGSSTGGTIPASKFTAYVPHFGYFGGCTQCTDFEITTGMYPKSSSFTVYDLDTGLVVLQGYSGTGTEGLQLYKNGVLYKNCINYYDSSKTDIEWSSDCENCLSRLFSMLNGYDRTEYRRRVMLDTQGGTAAYFDKSCGVFDYSFLSEILDNLKANGSVWGNVNTYCNFKIPVCDKIIVSIQATHSTQCIYQGEPLITTARVTYLDGSAKTVLCTTDFNVNILGKNRTAILAYTGYDTAYTKKTFTAAVDVTVIPKTKTCVNGHTYNLRSDGTDPGCPYCDGWLKSLTVTNPDTGELTIFRGTTLDENGVSVTAVYLNGRKEILSSGYANNLDKYYVGVQTVTIGYKGLTTTLKVTVRRNLKKCEVCGRYYELYPDDTDPGCPYCRAKIPVFTGNVLKYYGKTYSDEILRELYEGGGTYYFKEGDYISIEFTNRNKTLGTKLLGKLIPNLPAAGVRVEYGGDIRDDTVLGEH